MSNISFATSRIFGPRDQQSSPESLATISNRLDEIAVILSAGEFADAMTVDSIRRLGCHLEHTACTSASIAKRSGCPLASVDRHAEGATHEFLR